MPSIRLSATINPTANITFQDIKWKRVVIGTTDPNPEVKGRSVEVLKEKGVKLG
jgi:pyrimidine deaminase RibD-like protein